ncbi:MAG: type VII toxin-antitoxin system MntA family adenylyltransferase antitoxin [Candidatus Helarchaeota archaeon]
MDLEQIKTIVSDVFSKRDEVLLVYIYGSFLKTRYYNDIDIGILIKEDFKQHIFYEAGLARDLEKKLKVRIDLRVLNKMPLRFIFSVLQNSKLLFCRNEQIRIEFEEKVITQYIDFKYYDDLYDEIRRLKYAIG